MLQLLLTSPCFVPLLVNTFGGVLVSGKFSGQFQTPTSMTKVNPSRLLTVSNSITIDAEHVKFCYVTEDGFLFVGTFLPFDNYSTIYSKRFHQCQLTEVYSARKSSFYEGM